jgi:hypothetical protein
MCVVCGIAALFGIPAVYVSAKPLFGVVGLVTSLGFAAIPPLVVVGWRTYSRK